MIEPLFMELITALNETLHPDNHLSDSIQQYPLSAKQILNLLSRTSQIENCCYVSDPLGILLHTDSLNKAS